LPALLFFLSDFDAAMKRGKSGTANSWDLIIDPAPRRGAANMAVDEYLFDILRTEPRTIVRFYSWERPTASLGYGQPIDKVLDLDSCLRNGVDVVRRMTGGKLVLHWREITYSIASSDIAVFTSALVDSYRLISAGLIRGLEKMGIRAKLAASPPASYARGNMPCFAHPARDEIEVDGRKIVGSAQRRMAGRFLQHGSIPLQDDEGLLKRISLSPDSDAGLRRTSITQELGRAVDRGWAIPCLVRGLADHFGVRFKPLILEEGAEEEIRRLRLTRYENESWTRGKSSGGSCPVS
jgi:lipoate-protein ligase A